MTSSTPDAAKIDSISKDIGALEGKIRAECAKVSKQLGAEGLPCVGMGGGMGAGMGSCMGSGMGAGMGSGMMNHNGGHGGSGGHNGGGKGNCF